MILEILLKINSKSNLPCKTKLKIQQKQNKTEKKFTVNLIK